MEKDGFDNHTYGGSLLSHNILQRYWYNEIWNIVDETFL